MKNSGALVLILVVMEYTQWAIIAAIISFIASGLNPCCNGIYSMSISFIASVILVCLNPCCNGIYSMRTLSRYCSHY